MTPTLRPARERDLPALIVIEDLSFAQPHWTAPDFLKFCCMVAEVEGTIAGFLVTREVYPGDAQAPPECEILNLAIAPQFRRQGLAALLLQNELRPGRTYFLEVRESNVAAQTLYGQLGFQEMSRRPNYYQHPEETAIVMRWK